MARFSAILLIIIAALAARAAADTQPDAWLVQAGTLRGDYYFYATDQKRGEKVCSERWRFADDGIMTVFSGQEVVTQRFRLEQRETYNSFLKKKVTQSWLITTDPMSNGKPDCLGRTNNALTEHAMIVFRAADGGIVTCRPFNSFAIRPFGHFYEAAGVDAKTQTGR
ncbi:MAG TPA: hypothetical protein VMF58_11870 [Rhizomicrobium sp.]|nr:hypothetical protein [Rhizomicrobium sp.]